MWFTTLTKKAAIIKAAFDKAEALIIGRSRSLKNSFARERPQDWLMTTPTPSIPYSPVIAVLLYNTEYTYCAMKYGIRCSIQKACN
jgi:hypothetical protein